MQSYRRLCVYLHTALFSSPLRIPVIKEPFNEKIINSGRSESRSGESNAADCESSSSHDRLLHGNRSLHFTLTNKPWSVSICWISLVWCTGGKHQQRSCWQSCCRVTKGLEWTVQSHGVTSSIPVKSQCDCREQFLWLDIIVLFHLLLVEMFLIVHGCVWLYII